MKGFIYLLLAWLLLTAMLCFNCFAFEMDLDAIAQIESSNNPLKYNKKTKAYGLYQITRPCLEDVNNYLIATRYSLVDMYEPNKAYVVAYSYINNIIPHYLKSFYIPDTIATRIMCYDWGIGKVIKWSKGELSIPTETLDYIMKYDRLTREVNSEKNRT